MTISQIVTTTEKITKPPPSTMRSQKCNERSRRRHSARATSIAAQFTAAMERSLSRERYDQAEYDRQLEQGVEELR